MKKALLATLTIGAMLLASISVNAAAMKLRLATPTPEKSLWGAQLKKSVAAVMAASNGTLDIRVFYSSQLGDETTAIRQMVRGRIDITTQSTSATSLILPEFSLLGAPGLFESTKQGSCIFDNHVEKIFGEALEKKGMILLGNSEVGHGAIFSTRQLETVADAKKLKMRVAPTLNVTAWARNAGAIAVPLGVAELVPALKTGQVKALYTSALFGAYLKLYKMAPHVLHAQAHREIGTISVSKKTWKKMTPVQKSAMRLFSKYQSERHEQILKMEEMLILSAAKDGAIVVRPTGAVKKAWAEVGKATQREMVRSLGASGALYWEKIQAAKRACN